MSSGLEVADVVRRHGGLQPTDLIRGEAYRRAHDAHLGRIERRVMSAIELCRTAALGGHTEACADCGRVRCAYNSCRNRHCPKSGQARRVARRPTGRAAAGCRTSTSCSPCRRWWPRSPCRTRRGSMPFCSARRPRRCARSAASPCATPGARTHTIIRTLIASCLAAVPRSTTRACRLPPRVLPAGSRTLASLPAAFPRRAARRLCRWRTRLLRRACSARATRRFDAAPSRHATGLAGIGAKTTSPARICRSPSSSLIAINPPRSLRASPDAGSRTERRRHNPHSRARHPAGSLNPASMRSRFVPSTPFVPRDLTEAPRFPAAGEITGKYSNQADPASWRAPSAAETHGFRGKFPSKPNREIFRPNRERNQPIRESLFPVQP